MILGVLYQQRILMRLAKGETIAKLMFLVEESAQENVKLVVFSPASIDWWDNSVHGLTFNPVEEIWQPEKYPLPNAIYDRATFSKEEKEAGNLVRRRLKNEYKIPFLNNKHYFSKWQTHKTLTDYPEINKYLPETVLYTHPLILANFLEKYPVAYLKDSGGKLGRNILKVQQANQERYIITHQKRGKSYSDKLNLQGLHNRVINGKLAGKTVLIQQGIELAGVGERPFDIRLLAQKNGFGKWQVVDKSIRLGVPGSIVTNISSGGEAKKFAEVIPAVFPLWAATIEKEVDALALNVCRRLEEKFGTLCELGVDIAIDKQGQLWLIEVNGKPAKACIHRINDQAVVKRAYGNLIKYFKYLHTGEPR